MIINELGDNYKRIIEQLKEEMLKKDARITELEEKERDSKATLRRMGVQCQITKLLAGAKNFESVCEKILELICEAFDFEIGLFWEYDRGNKALFCTKVWNLEPGQIGEFEMLSRNMLFLPGVGLPGRLLTTGRPSWIVDVVRDNNFPRAWAAEKVGIHSAVGFPLLIGEEAFGIMEFFTHNVQTPDDNILDLMAEIGYQIGEFNWQNSHKNAWS